MQTFLSIAFSLVLAWACSHYAKLRGRNPMVWLVAGALFGIFALITLFILKKRPIPTLKNAVVNSRPAIELVSPEHADKFWYFLDAEKTQFGPMSFDALSRAWHEGKVTDKTFVWNEEMENWQPFKEVVQPPQTT